jgi:putative hydrolase of the HAD superfamily
MIKVVSFDLDGTLVDWTFSNSFWFDCIPRLYAERWGVGENEALKEVKRRYDNVGMDRLEWYDFGYWWKEFDLPSNPMREIKKCRPKVRAYPEAREALENLRGMFRLIVISNANRELALVEVEEAGFNSYFERVFSATSDFRAVKKTGEIYRSILKEMGLLPSEMVHVGDNYAFDYLAPREAGVRAYFLDRQGDQSGDFVVRDLGEFARRLMGDSR